VKKIKAPREVPSVRRRPGECHRRRADSPRFSAVVARLPQGIVAFRSAKAQSPFRGPKGAFLAAQKLHSIPFNSHWRSKKEAAMAAIVHAGWFRRFLAAGLVAILTHQAICQEPEVAIVPDPADTEPDNAEAVSAPEMSAARPPHLVVLRLPIKNIVEQLDRQIDFQTPVRDVILGTPVSGVARLVARPQIKLEPSDDRARFQVVFTGTVHSRTVANGGPAIVHGHSVTRFTATKDVVFEPGKGFTAGPPTVQASTQCFTDRIDSTRGGLVGRIVQRRAADEVASKRPAVTAIARQRATRKIAAAFDRLMDERLARLNKAVEFQIMLADFRTREGNRRLRASTTHTHVVLADVIHNNEARIELPALAASGNGKLPVEIWVHGSVVPPEIAQALETIFTNPDQSAIVNGLAALPGTFGKKAASVITALVSDNKVAIQNTGDWLVVQLSAQDEGRIATAPTNSMRR
jgi:hypothetical protein